jgi:putative FmdB family regulatory protein
MPIYEYQCNDCKTRSESIQSFSDAPLTVCSKCGGSLRKLISSPAVHFKGSGFYKTDYPSPGSRSDKSETKSSSSGEPKGDSKSESKSDSSGESKSDTKSDSKSETKSETKSESKSESKSSE